MDIPPLVTIPGGTFEMGDHQGFVDPDHPSDEVPIHCVTIDGFSMGFFDVTNRQYTFFLNDSLARKEVEVRSGGVYLTGRDELLVETRIMSPYSRIGWSGGAFTVLDRKEDHPVVCIRWEGAARGGRNTTAHRIAAGDIKVRHVRTRQDELGDLGDSLNAMASSLAKNIDALKLGLNATEQEREEFVEIILKESDHLGRLVNDLVQTAELRDSEVSLATVEGDLRAVFSDAVARFALPTQAKRVSIDVPGGGLVWMRFDPDRIVQVVDNLMSNALRHTPEGGLITVRVDASPGQVSMEVENTGDGIPEAQLRNLFEPFYRTDKARSRKHGGMGLGLTIVKGAVHAHGGTCEARNSGQGVIFRVVLPRFFRLEEPTTCYAGFFFRVFFQ